MEHGNDLGYLVACALVIIYVLLQAFPIIIGFIFLRLIYRALKKYLKS